MVVKKNGVNNYARRGRDSREKGATDAAYVCHHFWHCVGCLAFDPGGTSWEI
ncbi:hypothetical protein GCM10025854_04910 [Tetragenococcus muriaticus]|nr:hypothetical protein GCM10025854_02170 [Tetragenococcus muriaticus]GMA46085.1 hypothetical protein GCM10025854_03340 [Tetragenococcus muriaticus]GMA46242.1 hypothetical protein GCM10025854_04910 [Tetragenococcus muriaticus]